MRPAPDEVMHFSHDPSIALFRPHVARTAQQPEAYVWAVDAERAPDYWFPRDCPRVLAWATPDTTAQDRALVLGPGAVRRVHVIEYRWLSRMIGAQLFAYRLPKSAFRPFGSPVAHAHVAIEPVAPLAPAEPVGDLLAAHEEAGIELRLTDDLPAIWNVVTATTTGFSGIRLANAAPRPQPSG